MNNDMNPDFLIELIADAIDSNFGEGYAKAHPELVGAQLQAGAIIRLAEAIQNHPAP